MAKTFRLFLPLFFSILSGGATLSAQDLIVLNSEERIECRIVNYERTDYVFYERVDGEGELLQRFVPLRDITYIYIAGEGKNYFWGKSESWVEMKERALLHRPDYKNRIYAGAGINLQSRGLYFSLHGRYTRFLNNYFGLGGLLTYWATWHKYADSSGAGVRYYNVTVAPMVEFRFYNNNRNSFFNVELAVGSSREDMGKYYQNTSLSAFHPYCMVALGGEHMFSRRDIWGAPAIAYSIGYNFLGIGGLFVTAGIKFGK